MSNSLKWRLALVLGATGLGFLFLLPTLVGPGNVPAFLPQRALSLGLDLQGGLHLELKVETDKAVENTIARIAEDLGRDLREERVRVRGIETRPRGLSVTVRGAEGEQQLRELLTNRYGGVEVTDVAQGTGEDVHLTLTLTSAYIDSIETDSIDQGIETIRNRVDQFGVAEPSIVPRGEGEILIQLPGLGTLSADKVSKQLGELAADEELAATGITGTGTLVAFTSPDEMIADKLVAAAEEKFVGLIKDKKTINADGSVTVEMVIATSQRAKKLIGQTAQLEFRLLDETMPISTAMEQGPPPGAEVLYGKKKIDRRTGRELGQRDVYLVKKRVLMTGELVDEARFGVDSRQMGYEVILDFDNRGGDIFADITRESVGRNLAIVLDGVVQSAPVIREPITGGRASITGSFSRDEARDLSIALRSGSLPAPVSVQHEIEVGPSLGRDSIRAGVISFLVGGVLVAIFMLIYYRFAGILANLAVIVNMILLLGALAMLRGTLTLPGIAGIVLTVGMAVDANVLIYERIREELRLGKSAAMAVESGFNKAFGTILDANVTTLIAAVILYWLGSGPVRGFAVTLGLGILSSMFTAIVGTRVGFDLLLSRKGVKRLSI